jgi:hypothetical protein
MITKVHSNRLVKAGMKRVYGTKTSKQLKTKLFVHSAEAQTYIEMARIAKKALRMLPAKAIQSFFRLSSGDIFAMTVLLKRVQRTAKKPTLPFLPVFLIVLLKMTRSARI